MDDILSGHCQQASSLSPGFKTRKFQACLWIAVTEMAWIFSPPDPIPTRLEKIGHEDGEF